MPSANKVQMFHMIFLLPLEGMRNTLPFVTLTANRIEFFFIFCVEMLHGKYKRERGHFAGNKKKERRNSVRSLFRFVSLQLIRRSMHLH